MKKAKRKKGKKTKKILKEIADVVPTILQKIEGDDVFKEGNAIMKMINHLSHTLPNINIDKNIALVPVDNNTAMVSNDNGTVVASNITKSEGDVHSVTNTSSDAEQQGQSNSTFFIDIQQKGEKDTKKMESGQKSSPKTSINDNNNDNKRNSNKSPSSSNIKADYSHLNLPNRPDVHFRVSNFSVHKNAPTRYPYANNLLADDDVKSTGDDSGNGGGNAKNSLYVPTNPSNNRDSLVLDVSENKEAESVGGNVVEVKRNVTRGDIVGELAHFIPSLLKNIEGAEVFKQGHEIMKEITKLSTQGQQKQQQFQRNTRSLYDDEDNGSGIKRWDSHKQQQHQDEDDEDEDSGLDGAGLEGLTDSNDDEYIGGNKYMEYNDHNREDGVNVKPKNISTTTAADSKSDVEKHDDENEEKLRRTIQLERFLSGQLPDRGSKGK